MRGELIALVTTLCWSIGIFPFTEASKRIGTGPVNQWRLLLAWCIISVILFFTNSLTVIDLFSKPHLYHFVFLGLSGIIGFTIGDYCSFRSFTILGPKLGSLYTTFAPGAALIIGFLILGEKINLIGICGIAITIGGVIWLTLSKKDTAAAELAGFKRDKTGIILGIIGGLCQGTGLVLSKYGMDYYDEKLPTMHAVWIRLLFACITAFLVSLFAKKLVQNSKPIFSNKNNAIPFIIMGTLLGPICGVTCSLLTIQRIEVAVAQTIFALLPIVVLPINLLVYKEKITIQSVFACITAIVGVMLLIWRNKF
ncbi:MAG TPA: DMT family transporter [Bacteroidia bacterium]|jgi:drug/metabolite transporter (DMT)-like permease|nr:DMT family transporter [Bacteroidia bacterium]